MCSWSHFEEIAMNTKAIYAVLLMFAAIPVSQAQHYGRGSENSLFASKPTVSAAATVDQKGRASGSATAAVAPKSEVKARLATAAHTSGRAWSGSRLRKTPGACTGCSFVPRFRCNSLRTVAGSGPNEPKAPRELSAAIRRNPHATTGTPSLSLISHRVTPRGRRRARSLARERMLSGWRAKEAIMNKFMTSLIWVALGSSVLSLVIDRTGLITARETGNIEAQCPSKCQGDFPDSSKRKYARAPESSRLAWRARRLRDRWHLRRNGLG
jgi:hypothetical protein